MKERELIELAEEKLGRPIRKAIVGYRGDAEREIFRQKGIVLKDCRFEGPGESPVKECTDVVSLRSLFLARYAFWEGKNILVEKCSFANSDRAPFWYVNNLRLEQCRMSSPKSIRECDNVVVKDCRLNGIESFWQVRRFAIDGFQFKSYYPFLECSNGTIRNLQMVGKYSFQHCHDITIEDSSLDTKDAFWHSHDIVVRNSHLKGEYIAWYAENLTFVDCVIEGTQPFVCSKNLRFENCTFLKDADRAFERTTASGTLKTLPFSIYNPKDIRFQTEDTCRIEIDLPGRCRYDIHP